jgi:hypothetical protein
MSKKVRQIALVVGLITLIGLYFEVIPLKVADWLFTPCAALIIWKSGKYTKSYVIAQILIGSSIGVVAVQNALDGMIFISLWVSAFVALAEGVRLKRVMNQAEQ